VGFARFAVCKTWSILLMHLNKSQSISGLAAQVFKKQAVWIALSPHTRQMGLEPQSLNAGPTLFKCKPLHLSTIALCSVVGLT
jgi:hypothetical protein